MDYKSLAILPGRDFPVKRVAAPHEGCRNIDGPGRGEIVEAAPSVSLGVAAVAILEAHDIV